MKCTGCKKSITIPGDGLFIFKEPWCTECAAKKPTPDIDKAKELAADIQRQLKELGIE